MNPLTGILSDRMILLPAEMPTLPVYAWFVLALTIAVTPAALIVMLPVEPLSVMPLPCERNVTPLLVIVTCWLPELIEIPDPCAIVIDPAMPFMAVTPPPTAVRFTEA